MKRKSFGASTELDGPSKGAKTESGGLKGSENEPLMDEKEEVVEVPVTFTDGTGEAMPISEADDLPWATRDVLGSVSTAAAVAKGTAVGRASMSAPSDASSLVKRVHACSHLGSFSVGKRHSDALENLRKSGGFDKLTVVDFRAANTKAMARAPVSGFPTAPPPADVYRFNKCPPGIRGRALCIGNTYAGTRAALPGCDQDAKNMAAALTKLGYQAEVVLYATKAKLKEALLKYGSMDHSSCDSFVLYYSGHGNNDPKGAGSVIVTEDLLFFPRADLVDYLTPARAHRSLTGLPKLFFFDSCRGEKEATRWPLARDSDALSLVASRDVKATAAGVLQHTDILIAQATYFGEVSWGGKTGFWTDGLIYHIKQAMTVTYPVGWSTLLFNVNKQLADLVIRDGGEASGAEIHLQADVIVNAPPVPRAPAPGGAPPAASRADDNGTSYLKSDSKKPYYVISKEKAGYAVVIGNAAYKADGFNPLPPCKNDADKMEAALAAKGFTVIRKDDLKAREMLKLCHDLANKDEHGDGFVWYFSGHGDLGKFFGVDGKPVSIDEVTTSFRVMNCEALRGKPKIYLWDCCQGPNTSFVKGLKPELPEDADFFYGWATVEHYVSYADGPDHCSRWTYFLAEQLTDATEPLSVVLERTQGAMAVQYSTEQRAHVDSFLGYPVTFEI